MQHLLLISLAVVSVVHAVPHPPTGNVRVTTLINPPFVDQTDGAAGSEFSGMLVDMLKDMAKKLNFKYTIHLTADGKYGMKGADGSWTGSVGELARGNADLALLPLTVTPRRKDVITMSTPFMHSGVSMAIKRPPAGKPVPFTTFAELVEGKTNYSFGAVKLSSTAQALHNFTKEQYGDCLLLDDSQFVNSAADGLNRARSDNFAFIASDSTLDFVTAKPPCDLMTLPLGFGKQAYALGLPKSQEDWVSPFLTQMRDSGKLGELETKWFSGECKKPKMCMCN